MVTTRQAPSSVAVLAAPKDTTSDQTFKRLPVKAPAGRPKRIQKFSVRKPTTKFSKKNANPSETVEVVKMLTGILYLYRGTNPRVEFVRKV